MNDFDKYIVQQRKHHFWITVETSATKKYAEAYASVAATEQNPTRIMQFSQRKYETVLANIVSTLVLMVVAIISHFTQWPELAAVTGILFFAMLTYTLFVICHRKNDGLFW